MKAIQYREIGKGPELVEIPTPEPGPGQIRLKVTAAGLCHSDWFLMDLPADQYIYPLPLTLGHEGAGVVDKLGDGVEGIELGGSYAIYGPWGCGQCHACTQGKENYCTRAAELGIAPPGLGAPGAMAEYVIVDDARHLVPLGDLDPVETVSLTDAGLTPYHAIMSSASKLRAGATAVVIGAGGLGHVGIQVLRAVSPATVIALDINDEKLSLAREVGAHHTLMSDESAVAKIRELTGGVGAEAVFDFTGMQATLDIARQVVAVDGDIQIVGIGGGLLPTGFFSTPFGASVRAPYWGSRSELVDVLDLARTGSVGVHVERYTLDSAVEAYGKLHSGNVRGRAVVVP
ncbi:NAD(P)-dependent alcohol dehydrogenase [Microbacterium esteraromaticum]|uniref:NAD(P)-dependent alcohol dehydrogenase n=1 Tax=Microbacterium esteraromaticum TaxID=57043 RepID=UPI0019D3A185|nr:NAD(P)-dependent alcohol dehydrogenase [Microbacterium esteraromaticum]MBN7794039.1 NAD(P)-dependent alcohol dehydrogenase [Microbacterium esteraromaticum]MCA1307170.1 NAD(P)-dependent alcohol dehydrogenase [Microbacterium esteraromaticum]WDH78838.1 NAD(P)-dependent alcohol dehydrogenase [Microbacterium esteraromaticum]